jgi:CubicO group peptidase (beta-lactamase class C family)
MNLKNLICILTISIPLICFGQQPPMQGGSTYLPDAWLLGGGQRWHYHSATARNIQELKTREPSAVEAPVIEKAKSLLANSAAKSIAMIDGNEIVWVGYKSPAGESSRFLGASVAKTVTSMGVGKAICNGKLSLNTIAEDVVLELKGTDLGRATVKDLLTMTSGSWNGLGDGTIFEKDQEWPLANARLSILDVVKTPKVTAAELDERGEKRRPGQLFSYHNTDPLLLGIMINKSVGMSYAKWIEKEVLIPAGIKESVIIGQDWFDFAYAEGNVRMTMTDWIRFAIWVKNNDTKNDCFGDYVRAATKTEIKNLTKKTGQNFDGYGYLIWTENKLRKDSYWASGWGGQRIGWNHENQRMMITFSNSENIVGNVYSIYADWASLPSKK